jgi:prevent-host-death family protein
LILATWKVGEAKARFSELVELSRTEGPQDISRHGRRVAVVVAAEVWDQRMARRGSLVEFLRQSPLPDSGLEIERLGGRMREPAA